MQDERQLILADQNFRDIRPVMGAEIDMAIGSDENDYEIKIRRDQWDDRYKYGNVFTSMIQSLAVLSGGRR